MNILKINRRLSMIKLLPLVFFFMCSVSSAFEPIYHIGNLRSYEYVTPVVNSVLNGKTILFLGSSVTEGATSERFSFVDILARRHGINAIKEAVSGTTLVDNGENSYISRLKKYKKDTHFDTVVVQLSTNDAWQNFPLLLKDSKDNPTHSIEGSILFIIDYIKKNWNIPIIFYTNPPFGNEKYDAMVNLLEDIAKEKNIKIVNIYRDDKFNNLAVEEKGLYMYDAIHPTKAGYLNWMPKFEDVITSIFYNIKYRM